MLTVGIVGTGVGVRTYLPAFTQTVGARVKGIAGSSAARSAAVAEKYGIERSYARYQDLCDDAEINLICVTSPNQFHREQCAYALSTGKSVICEKPLAMTLSECRELIAIRDACPDRMAFVNHQLRLNPYIKSLKAMMANGVVGRPFYIRIHQQGPAFSDPKMLWSWSFSGEQGGGVRLAMGSHLVDLVHYVLGERFAEVRCNLDLVYPKRFDAVGVEQDVTGSGFFALHGALTSGVTIDLTATAAAHGKSRFDISIYGDSGEIQFDLENKLRLSDRRALGKEATVDVDSVFDDERQNKASIFSGSFRYVALAVREAFEAGAPIVPGACSFEEARECQAVLDAALLSHQEERGVVMHSKTQRAPTRAV